jgi:DNA repair photolyase
MSLKKNKAGSNMYPWISAMHTHLGGQCSHKCSYCYTQVSEKRFKSGLYSGPVRLREKEFDVNYGTGNTIFIEHMNDLFAKDVPNEWIEKIINHTKKYPKNTYVFQTKNPARYFDFINKFPKGSVLGTTIETNRIVEGLNEAPIPEERMKAMSDKRLKKMGFKKFLTIEPVLKFDIDILAKWVSNINPDFINLGADSKGFGMEEPTVEEIMALVAKLKEYGIDLREKHNLQRLLPK